MEGVLKNRIVFLVIKHVYEKKKIGAVSMGVVCAAFICFIVFVRSALREMGTRTNASAILAYW